MLNWVLGKTFALDGRLDTSMPVSGQRSPNTGMYHSVIFFVRHQYNYKLQVSLFILASQRWMRCVCTFWSLFGYDDMGVKELSYNPLSAEKSKTQQWVNLAWLA